MTHFLRFLLELFTTAAAGKPSKAPIVGPAGAAVIEPPAGAKPNGKARDAEDEDEEDEEEDADGAEEREEDADGKDADDADASEEEDADDDADEDEEKEDDEDGEDEEDDEDEDEEEDEEEDDGEDEAASGLRTSWVNRLASDAKVVDPDFTARGVSIDFTRAKLSAERRAALKGKLVPKDAEEDVARDADAVLDAMEEVGREVVTEILSQYHNGLVGPVNHRLTLAERKASNRDRMAELVKKHGDRITPEVEKKMGEIYLGLVKDLGHYTKADQIPYEDLYRMVPKSIRNAPPSKKKGGKQRRDDDEEEGPEERRARRERDGALAAGAAPRGGIGRVSPKGGSRKQPSKEETSQREVAETIRRTGGKFF